MTYCSTVLATNFEADSWQVRLLRILLFFIPLANPDNEQFYRHVKKWYLELNDSGMPIREIGIASDGRPLFGAPNGRNVGFWTDSDKKFQPNELNIISVEEFERLWNEVQRSPRSLSPKPRNDNF